jgi:molybdenum cofactor guanylyltransferase
VRARERLTAESAEGWVLAGGQSRRMGRDKAATPLAGQTLLQRMLDKLHALGVTAHVAGGSAGELPAATFVADRLAGLGPMSGLETALRHSESPLVLVLGVDLPLLSVTLLAALLERARLTGALATIPYALGRPQPLCAVYRRALAAPIARLLAAGTHKPMLAVEQAAAEAGGCPQGGVDRFDVETLLSAGAVTLEWPVMWEFLNCNTPAELALAERLLRQESTAHPPAR